MSAWHSSRRLIVTLLLGCCLSSNVLAQLRVVTLSPHATELVFAAGAGEQIVATVQASDYPPSAQQIPRIGNGITTGIEQVLAQHPDLVIGWPSNLLRQLAQHGIATYSDTADSLPALLQTLEDLGARLGTPQQAQRTVGELREALDRLPPPPSTPLRVLVLASPQGDYVIGRDGLMNDALRRCGGINPFANHPLLAPKVNLESMISSKPDLIVTGHPPSDRLQQIAPVHVIDADLLFRPGPRFFEATRLLCAAIAEHALKP